MKRIAVLTGLFIMWIVAPLLIFGWLRTLTIYFEAGVVIVMVSLSGLVLDQFIEWDNWIVPKDPPPTNTTGVEP